VVSSGVRSVYGGYFNVPPMLVIGTPSPTILIGSLGVDFHFCYTLTSVEAQKAEESIHCALGSGVECLQVTVAWILPKVH